MTRCTTSDEFIATFRRLVDAHTVFVVMREPKPASPPRRFSIQLADGTPVLEGEGRVLESIPAGPGVTRPGMRIELAQLDEASRSMHQRLLAAKAAAAPPPLPPPLVPVAHEPHEPTAVDAVPLAPPPLPRITQPPPLTAGPSLPAPPAQPSSPAQLPSPPSPTLEAPLPVPSPEAPAAAPTRPATSADSQRVPGSAYTLPANPFGEIAPEALEYFIECTLYEDSGVFSPLDQVAPALHEGAAGPAAPLLAEPLVAPAGSPAPTKLMFATPAAAGALPLPAPPILPPPPAAMLGARPDSVPAADVAAMAAMTMAASPGPTALPLPAPPPSLVSIPATGSAADETNDVRLLPSRRSQGRNVVIAAVVTGLVGLGGGYLLWGRGTDGPGAERQASPSAEAAAKTSAAERGIPADPARPGDPTSAATGVPGAAARGETAPGANATATTAAKTPETSGDPVASAIPSNPNAPSDENLVRPGGPTPTPVGAGQCSLTVGSTPPGAEVLVGTAPLGRTPFSGPAPCGDAMVSIVHPRYERIDRPVSLTPATPAVLDERLVRPDALLDLVSVPAGARFTVNGAAAAAPTKVLGYTFVTVTATLDGHKPWSQKVYVRGHRMTVSAKLEAIKKPPPPKPGKPVSTPKPGAAAPTKPGAVTPAKPGTSTPAAAPPKPAPR